MDSKKLSQKRFGKAHSFLTWAKMQESPPELIDTLAKLLENADDSVVDWLQPTHWKTDRATFVNHHIVFSGRKK